MEHWAPHPNAMFEGYYSKFDLPSGAHIALIISTVPDATTHPPHMVSFTYYPASGSPIYQRAHWVDSIQRLSTGPSHAFELRVAGLGSMSVTADSTTTYDFECEEWTLQGMTTDRTPWSDSKSTPEGLLVHLPLPLHWHVHSLSSSCAFVLKIPSLDVPSKDAKGRATVHQEKNWASSFPESHMWVQARSSSTSSSICLAGGKILGMTAYILGYRSPTLSIDFAPPYALAVFGISPFMSVDVDWPNCAFQITVSGLWRKLRLKAQAPKEKGWFGLGAPSKKDTGGIFVPRAFWQRSRSRCLRGVGWVRGGSWRGRCSRTRVWNLVGDIILIEGRSVTRLNKVFAALSAEDFQSPVDG